MIRKLRHPHRVHRTARSRSSPGRPLPPARALSQSRSTPSSPPQAGGPGRRPGPRQDPAGADRPSTGPAPARRGRAPGAGPAPGTPSNSRHCRPTVPTSPLSSTHRRRGPRASSSRWFGATSASPSLPDRPHSLPGRRTGPDFGVQRRLWNSGGGGQGGGRTVTSAQAPKQGSRNRSGALDAADGWSPAQGGCWRRDRLGQLRWRWGGTTWSAR